MKRSVSVVIPAYNEGEELKTTIADVDMIVKRSFDDYELLIFDDCSTDKTGELADELAKKNPRVRVFHNKENMNMGYNFRMGIKNAAKNYVVLLSGPDSVSLNSIETFMGKVGETCVLSSYIANQETRPRHRRIISFLVTNTLNLLFGLKLGYYFGMQAYETKIAKKLKTTTNSFALLAEALIRSIKKGYPHKEIPYYVRKTKGTSTTAFRMRNVAGIIALALRLFFDVNFGKGRK